MKIFRRYHQPSEKKPTISRGLVSIVSSDEQQLWRDFLKGSKTAFEALYYRYVNILYDYGVRLSRDSQLAEDCLQDLFTYLWEHQHKLPEVKAVQPYLLVSLKRRLYRKLSEQQKDISKIYEALESTSSSFDPDTDDDAECMRALKSAFAKLSEKQKEVIYLKFYNQLTYEEIAEVMDVKVKSIYKLMGRAVAKLKKHVSKQLVSQFLLEILAS